MKLVATMVMAEEQVRAIVPDIEFVQANSAAEALAAAVDADIVWLGGFRDIIPQLVQQGKHLRWIHCYSAGVDDCYCGELMNSDLILTCGKGGPVGSLLAEHAFAMMLALTRGIASEVRAASWNHQGEAARNAFEVGGKVMGIVGFGGVGKALAKRAKAFDMEVIAVKRQLPVTATAGAMVWPVCRLPEMLECADIVVITVPHTAQTVGMFDRAAFRSMKKKALLIAVGRGKTVDTAALVDALKQGEIAGAGLDVVDPEPLPDNHPLWTFPNVIITSHIAGNAPERAGRNQTLVLENLKRFINKEPLASTFDRASGY